MPFEVMVDGGAALSTDAAITGYLNNSGSSSSSANPVLIASSGSLAGLSTYTFSSISGYSALRLVPTSTFTFSGSGQVSLRYNGDTGNNYWSQNALGFADPGTSSITLNYGTPLVFGTDIQYVNVAVPHINFVFGANGSNLGFAMGGHYTAAAITSITLMFSVAVTTGSVSLYGIPA